MTADRVLQTNWVFFDLRWTLVDETRSDETFFLNLFELLVLHGAKLSKAKFRARVRNLVARRTATSHRRVADALFDSYAGKGSKTEFLNKLFSTNMEHEYARKWTLNRDVMPALRWVAKNHSCGIIANQPKSSRSFIENRKELKSCFKVIAFSAEFGVAKPDPEVFIIALRKAGCQARGSIYVGDRVDNDIAPAKSLGMTTVRIRRYKSLFSNIEPVRQKEHANYEIDDLRSLKGILEENV